MDELKPCPFCGGEAAVVTMHNENLTWVRHKVNCKRCLAETTGFESWRVAEEAWNRRAGDGNE